jgi:murein DD-endopeptidase MepM/ murein hydrolase activator NlpD
MKRNTLVKIVLTGTLLLAPQRLSNIASQIDDTTYSYNNIEVTNPTPLEKAGLKIYGENPQALGTEYAEFYRLVYSNKRDILNPTGLTNLEKKTPEELKKGLILKDQLENQYKILLTQYNFDMTYTNWGKLVNGYQSIPKDSYSVWNHEAIDIFTKENNKVLAPFNGLIVASGDYWQGTFYNREPVTWNNKGLSPRSGNAVIIYNPIDRGYMLIAHFREGLSVKAGDIITKGQVLGYVGHSGSASIKGHGEHIHVAYKLRDKDGYLESIDFFDRIKR